MSEDETQALSPVQGDAETLRRAAALVRELAQEATPGPWRYFGPTEALPDADAEHGYDEDAQVRAGSMLEHPSHHSPHELVAEADALFALGTATYEDDRRILGSHRWIALMGPQVAEPLALMLEEAARSADVTEARGGGVSRGVGITLMVARALLGTERPA